jgi:hypothetical protein
LTWRKLQRDSIALNRDLSGDDRLRGRAIAWLQKAEAAHSVSLTAVKVEPLFDPLRADPRFRQLLRKMNFPQ